MKIVEFKRPDGKNINLEIIKYSPTDLSRNKTPDRHRHNFHSLFFIRNGRSIQEVDFTDYRLSKNHIIIIPKGSVHWEKTMKNLSGYTILFKDDFFSAHQRQLLHGLLNYAIALRKLLIKIEKADLKSIESYFELLMMEQETPRVQNKIFILQNLMLALFNKLESILQNSMNATSFLNHSRPFQQYVDLVETTFVQQKGQDYYASALNITKRKLNYIVKNMTGQTANNYVIDRIMLEAKRHLCFTNKSVKEIAFDLGYESQHYFSRLFKKRNGVNPEAFRQSNAQ